MNKDIAAAAAVLSLAPGLALAGEATRPGYARTQAANRSVAAVPATPRG